MSFGAKFPKASIDVSAMNNALMESQMRETIGQNQRLMKTYLKNTS